MGGSSLAKPTPAKSQHMMVSPPQKSVTAHNTGLTWKLLPVSSWELAELVNSVLNGTARVIYAQKLPSDFSWSLSFYNRVAM